MQNRLKTIEATKAYALAFNAQDTAAIADLLDEECIFSRQEQNTIVGKESVLRRIRNLFWRADEQNKSLHVVNAIADLGQSKARPCLITLVNDVPLALCVISCKPMGKINAIAVLLSGDVVSLARPTEKLPGRDDADLDPAKANEKRADVLAKTREYLQKFNNRDLVGMGDLFDVHKTSFHRSDQRAIIGRNEIQARIRDLYGRVDKHGQDLVALNAIMDFDAKSAWPCFIGYIDGTATSVGWITLRQDGLIASINVNIDPLMIAKARPTEKLPEPKKKQVTLEQVLEREEWLQNRMSKIGAAIKKHGRLPHLVTKELQIERQMQKIEYLKKKLSKLS